jgi:hypothetical protein
LHEVIAEKTSEKDESAGKFLLEASGEDFY